MDEGLTAIAAVFAIMVAVFGFMIGVFGFLCRAFQFLCGLTWIFSRSYRASVAKDHPAMRWLVYEGVFYAVVGGVIGLIALGVFLVTRLVTQ